MKTAGKQFSKLMGTLVTIGLMMNLAGCSKEFLPMEPEQNQKEAIFETQKQVPNNQLKILNFQTGNKSLGKKKKVSKIFTKEGGGKLTMAVGDDIRLIEYINQMPPIHSGRLAQGLMKVSPLSVAVLIAAVDRQPRMNSSYLYSVLRKNTPLNSQVMAAVFEKRRMFKKNQLYQLIYASLPLPPVMWSQIQRLGFTELQFKRLTRKQNQAPTNITDVPRNAGNPCAKVTFELPPGAIEEELEISICMDDEQLSGDIFIEFGPHGIFFKEPAKLNIEIYGLKFKKGDDFEVEDLGLYYVNQETGLWEKMKFKKIQVDRKKGTIKVIDAELPHFSRYAIGSE